MNIDTSVAMMGYQDTKLGAQNQNLNQAHLKGVSSRDEDSKLREQTDNFEALILKIMLQDAIKNDDALYPKQAGSDIYHSMYIDQLSDELSGSFGYSELLFNFLKEQQNAGKAKAQAVTHKGIRNSYGHTK